MPSFVRARRTRMFQGAASSSQLRSTISALTRKGAYVSTWARLPADLPRSCSSARRRAFTPSTSFEATDIRALSPHLLEETPDFITIDVSFISLKSVLPSALALAKKRARLVALIKPQFEAGRAALKKGIVRDRAVHVAVCDEIEKSVSALGWRVVGTIESPITGGDGNVEFLLGAGRD